MRGCTLEVGERVVTGLAAPVPFHGLQHVPGHRARACLNTQWPTEAVKDTPSPGNPPEQEGHPLLRRTFHDFIRASMRASMLRLLASAAGSAPEISTHLLHVPPNMSQPRLGGRGPEGDGGWEGGEGKHKGLYRRMSRASPGPKP